MAIVVLVILIRIAPVAAVVDHKVDGVRTAIPRAAWMLGIMALAFGLSEGTAADWSSIHVTDVAGVDSDHRVARLGGGQRFHGASSG